MRFTPCGIGAEAAKAMSKTLGYLIRAQAESIPIPVEQASCPWRALFFVNAAIPLVECCIVCVKKWLSSWMRTHVNSKPKRKGSTQHQGFMTRSSIWTTQSNHGADLIVGLVSAASEKPGRGIPHDRSPNVKTFGCGSKIPGTQKTLLVKGKIDKNLRFFRWVLFDP